MLRFKHLHYGKLFTQGGKGHKKINNSTKITVPQQGGAMGFDGVDYPHEDTFSMYKDDDVKKVISLVKAMHKVLLGQSAEHLSDPKNKRFVDDLLDEYKQVENDGWDPNDLWGLYSNLQYSFTDPNEQKYLELPKKTKATPKAATKAATVKAPAGKKAATVKVDTKDMKEVERKISAKMANYRMIILATSKKFMALKSKDRTPEINNEMLKIKARHDEAKTKYDYWKKRMHKVNPDHLTENLSAQIQECKDDLKSAKDKLDAAEIEKSQLRYELKQCLDKKDPEKIAMAKKGTVSQASSFKVAEVKPIEQPVDIDAELARLDVMKKALVSPSLNSYTIAELKAIAKKEKIVGVSGLKKKQLVQLIIDGRTAKKNVAPKPSVKIGPPPPKDDMDEIIASVVQQPSSSSTKKASSSGDIKKDPIYINNTVLELKAKCKELGLTGYGHKNKEQLAMMVKSKAKLPKAIKQKGSSMSDIWDKIK